LRLLGHFYYYALSFILAGCVPVVEYVATDIQIKTNSSPKIIQIRNTANTVQITTNKQIYGLPVLVTQYNETVTESYKASGKSVIFSFDDDNYKHECYKIKIISNVQTFLTPSGREFKSDWCFKNTLRIQYIDNIYKGKREDKKLFRLQEDFHEQNALSGNFPEQCKNPKPIVPAQPAQYCSNKSIVNERLNQCDAPLIARICKSGTPILLNKEFSKSESRALTPACKIFADQWVGKETKPSDLVYAQVKAELISHAGSLKEGIAWTVALLETYSCKARIHSQCNPKQPAIPDCTEWEGHTNRLSALSDEIELVKFNRNESTTDIIKYKNDIEIINF